jgi:plastocyanin
MRRSVFVSVFVMAIAFAAASPAAAAVVKIEIKGIAFPPAKATAKVGDTVEWTNKDFVAHTATARDKSFDVNLPPAKSGRTVLKKPGKIAYYCRYHPNMTAEIDVSAK